jgi:hypothetical protein
LNKLWILFLFTIILSLNLAPILFENAFAQEIIPPRKQWKQVHDIELLSCKSEMLLLQKSDGTPACVSPSTYLKLIDRKYAKYDSTFFVKQPEMIETLLNNMVSNQNMMQHWHDMMIQNPKIMQETMSMWIPKMKDDPNFLKKFMNPMIDDPDLREKMIANMKEHPVMMNTLKENTAWMRSVHEKMTGMDSPMGQEHSGADMHSNPPGTMQHGMYFHNQDIMMDMIHHMWITDTMRDKMTKFMLEDSTHMHMMTDQLMVQILNPMMDDSMLRQYMMDIMLENNEFMNSVRHENQSPDN